MSEKRMRAPLKRQPPGVRLTRRERRMGDGRDPIGVPAVLARSRFYFGAELDLRGADRLRGAPGGLVAYRGHLALGEKYATEDHGTREHGDDGP